MSLAVDTYHVGDCRDLLRQMDEQSVHCCVTSPPYWGLRDYGTAAQIGLEKTPDAYVAELVSVFREVRRVLRDDATLWLNLGDSYSGGVIGRNDMDDETLARRAERYGTGRGAGAGPRGKAKARAVPDGLKSKDLVGIPWSVAMALRADGWYLRSDIIWAKPNPMPESVTDRPTKAHEYVFLLAKSAAYYYDVDAIREPHVSDGRGGFSNKETLKSVRAAQSHAPSAVDAEVNPAGRNRRSVWTIATEPTPDAHFATFPQKLVEPCILAGSPLGGVVLDPFGGSGTTGRVAEDLGRHWVLMDLNPEYAKIAKRKTAQIGLLGRMA